MKFEWDENKNQANIKKHRLDFEFAKWAFNDDEGIKKINRIVDGEVRYQLIAQIEGIVIVLVIFTMRDENYRIISARRSSKKEREVYNAKK